MGKMGYFYGLGGHITALALVVGVTSFSVYKARTELPEDFNLTVKEARYERDSSLGTDETESMLLSVRPTYEPESLDAGRIPEETIVVANLEVDGERNEVYRDWSWDGGGEYVFPSVSNLLGRGGLIRTAKHPEDPGPGMTYIRDGMETAEITLEIVVDPDNLVMESDETDNTLRVPISMADLEMAAHIIGRDNLFRSSQNQRWMEEQEKIRDLESSGYEVRRVDE